MSYEPLKNGSYYHIFNCGINGCNIFIRNNDYEHFLLQYAKYIDPIAETYAWVLMGNHFHFLVKIKENINYRYSSLKQYKTSLDRYNIENSSNNFINGEITKFDDIKWHTIENKKVKDNTKVPNPSKHFAHLFNSYSKYFNKLYDRHGSLFESPFERKRIEYKKYLKNLILYIHNNPVHHEFCNHPEEHPWSSYIEYNDENPKPHLNQIILSWFGNIENFKNLHNEKASSIKVEDWIEY